MKSRIRNSEYLRLVIYWPLEFEARRRMFDNGSRWFLAGACFQAKGELSAARAEIDELKEDKSVLGKALEEKAKEIRVQLAQVLGRVRGSYSARLKAAPRCGCFLCFRNSLSAVTVTHHRALCTRRCHGNSFLALTSRQASATLPSRPTASRSHCRSPHPPLA